MHYIFTLYDEQEFNNTCTLKMSILSVKEIYFPKEIHTLRHVLTKTMI